MIVTYLTHVMTIMLNHAVIVMAMSHEAVMPCRDMRHLPFDICDPAWPHVNAAV